VIGRTPARLRRLAARGAPPAGQDARRVRLRGGDRPRTRPRRRTAAYRLALGPATTYRFRAHRGSYAAGTSTRTASPDRRSAALPHPRPRPLARTERGHPRHSSASCWPRCARCGLDAGAPVRGRTRRPWTNAPLRGTRPVTPGWSPTRGVSEFSAADARPLARSRGQHRLPWLAVHRDLAEYRGTATLATPICSTRTNSPRHSRHLSGTPSPTAGSTPPTTCCCPSTPAVGTGRRPALRTRDRRWIHHSPHH